MYYYIPMKALLVQKNINCIIPTTGTTEVGVLCDFQLMAVLSCGFTFGQLFLFWPIHLFSFVAENIKARGNSRNPQRETDRRANHSWIFCWQL